MAGNYFDQFDGQGIQIKPADPTEPYKVPKTVAEINATNASAGKSAVDATVTRATLPSTVSKAQSEAILAAAQAAKAQQGQSDTAAKDRATQIQKLMDSDVVLKAIKEAKGEIGPYTTGTPGALFHLIPGTDAYNLRRSLDTVGGNIAFDRYSQLKENMPAGAQGGLRLTDNEIKLLRNLQGNLDPGQGAPLLTNHLDSVEQQYRRNAALAAGLDPNNPDVQRRLNIAPASPDSLTARALGKPGTLAPAVKAPSKIIDFKDLP